MTQGTAPAPHPHTRRYTRTQIAIASAALFFTAVGVTFGALSYFKPSGKNENISAPIADGSAAINNGTINNYKINLADKPAEAEFSNRVKSQVAQLDDLQQDIKAITDAASENPDKAISVSWGLIERRIKRVLALTHWGNGIFVDVRTGIQTLVDLDVIARNTVRNLKVLQDEHDRVAAHRAQGDRPLTVSAIVTAIQILKVLYAINPQENVVEAINVKLYSDEACQDEIKAVSGVAVKMIMEGDPDPTTRVFPTKRTDYKIGERLTWDWNASQTWNYWYKDLKTGTPQKVSAVEFVGSDVGNL